MSGAAALQFKPTTTAPWGRAAAIAVALHLTAILAAVVTLKGEIEDEAGGMPAIEISLAPAAPRVEDAPDLPPGPLSNESAAAAPSAASAETKQAEDQKLVRNQADDGELAHSEKSDKPVDDTQKQQTQQMVSSESAAAEATAPPKTETPTVADKPAAPTHGADKAASAAVLTWQKALIAHLHKAKRYPPGVRHTAEVMVAFTLDRRGHVTSASVKTSSGVAVLDDAALAMMKRADPVPAPPPALADTNLSFEVPVQFRAHHK